MKNLQQTEKHLADKLQNVPVPDVDQGWEQMRKLLDQDMPEPVAGAWSGNRKWWWMGITAGIIMLATWLTQELNNNAVLAEKQDAGNKTTIKNKEANNNDAGNNVSVKENNTPVATDNSSNGTSNNSVTINSSDKNSNSNAVVVDKSANNIITGNNSTKQGFSKNDVHRSQVSIKPADGNAKTTLGNSRPAGTNTKIASGNDISIVSDKPTDNQRLNKVQPNGDPSAVNKSGVAATDDIISKPANAHEAEASVINIVVDTENESSSPANQFNEINYFQPEQIAVSGKTDKAFAREMRKKSMKADNRRISRSSMRGGSADNEKELTFAAGLALPQSFAVGSQQSSSYNVNGGSGRITDYLPAPFFQYHINNKLFLQTEIHFQSPQHTQRLLLSRNVDTLASRVYENNVHLEKLYYFNIPFNVFYSPARNFYIGGGLQYSSLLSGVASYENRTSEGPTVLNHNSVARRFNYDSVAAAFSPSEWRYQFDANYYFNRFTLGLRYNQAMTDFIDIRGGGYVPPTRDRNKSFLLYLRFNIWEERKKH